MAVKPVVLDETSKKHRPLGTGERMDGLSALSFISSDAGNLLGAGSDGLAYLSGTGISDASESNVISVTQAGRLSVLPGDVASALADWMEAHPGSSAGLAGALADGTGVVVSQNGKLSLGDASGALATASGTTEPRTLADRFADVLRPEDFGAAGDGQTDDSDAFAALERAFPGAPVDLGGRTFRVSGGASGLPPSGCVYCNGSFLVDVPGSSYEADLTNEIASRHDGVTGSGIGSYPNYFLAVPDARAKAAAMSYFDSDRNAEGSRLNDVVAIGYDALKGPLANAQKRVPTSIAIGAGTLSQGTYVGPHNIAIGAWALRSVQSTKPNDTIGGFDGDRNVAIGTLCYPAVTTGRANVGLGRDVGQSLTTGSYNVAVGYGALAGYAPVDLSGAIANEAALTGSSNVAVGRAAGASLVGGASNNVFLGVYAGGAAKSGGNTMYLGAYAGRYIDYFTSTNGKKLKYVPDNATAYSQTGSALTISLPDSGAVVGGYAVVKFLSGGIYENMPLAYDRQTLTVTAVSASGFTVRNDATYTRPDGTVVTYDGMSGTCNVLQIELADEQAPVGANGGVLLGFCAGQYISSCSTSNVIGAWALRGTNVDDIANSDRPAAATSSNILGSLSCIHSRVEQSDVVGYRAAGYQDTNTVDNVNGLIEYSELMGMLTVPYTTKVTRSVVVGYGAVRACKKLVGDSVVIGCDACGANEDANVNASVVIGYGAGSPVATNTDVFIGRLAANAGDEVEGHELGTTTNCIGIGHGSFYVNSDLTAGVTNSVAIGYHSAVTGSNQFQLGSSGTTVYAYGAVQDRSDARDKADVRDTVLGLDFLKALRPVDFRWDYRDDYVDYVEREEEYLDPDGRTAKRTAVSAVRREKDGSRKRARFHHGLIAQEVKAVMDAQGIDFGGYQDHKVNGGADVLTLGYEELVAPIVKAIQQLDARLAALEA